MNSVSGYELGFGSGLSANKPDLCLSGRIHPERRVRARLTAGLQWPTARPPRELAGWAEPVGCLGFGPLGLGI
jgi:hypothetical protein